MSAVGAPVIDSAAIARLVKRIAHAIVENNRGGENPVLIGVVRRGAKLAERLALALKAIDGREVPIGALDVSLYRDDGKAANDDDLRRLGDGIPVTLDDRRVILVDDVVYTGRTVRAAMEALTALGRPQSIQLAVLVDRGGRELPIRADYVGKNVETPPGQRVYVRLSEIDGIDTVVVGESR